MATDAGETELTLRIDLDADPITGTVVQSHGAARRFSGWIGLAAALELIRAEVRPKDQGRCPYATPPDSA